MQTTRERKTWVLSNISTNTVKNGIAKGHLQSAVLAVLQGFSAFNAPKLQD